MSGIDSGSVTGTKVPNNLAIWYEYELDMVHTLFEVLGNYHVRIPNTNQKFINLDKFTKNIYDNPLKDDVDIVIWYCEFETSNKIKAIYYKQKQSSFWYGQSPLFTTNINGNYILVKNSMNVGSIDFLTKVKSF